jgi:hypothetical protein
MKTENKDLHNATSAQNTQAVTFCALENIRERDCLEVASAAGTGLTHEGVSISKN